MRVLKSFFSQKVFWGGLIALILVVFIFTIGIMSSIVNPKPSDLPVALVVADQGLSMPNNSINFGETVKENLTRNEDIPFEWTVLDNKEEAISQMNEKSFYATIFIPENTSRNIFSLLQENPQQPEIEVIINEGMNYTAASTTSQIIDRIVTDMNIQVQNMIYTQLDTQGLNLPSEKIKLIINPLNMDKQIINNVDSNTANGNTPVLFTQILWLSVFICSLLLFLTAKKTTNTGTTLSIIVSQLIGGILFLLVIVSSMMIFTKFILDVHIPNEQSTFLFLLFTGLVFFLLQNALFNWIGIIASPFILLLFLFSIPVLNFPPEFLPALTKDLLYSWLPLKFSVEGLRDIFFFDSNQISQYMRTLGYLGIAALVVTALATLKKHCVKEKEVKKRAENKAALNQ